MLYNNIKFGNKCIFYMSTCCTSFENLGFYMYAPIEKLTINYIEKTNKRREFMNCCRENGLGPAIILVLFILLILIVGAFI